MNNKQQKIIDGRESVEIFHDIKKFRKKINRIRRERARRNSQRRKDNSNNDTAVDLSLDGIFGCLDDLYRLHLRVRRRDR